MVESAFNRMADAHLGSRRELESRVEQKTRALASALGFPNNFRAEILEHCKAVVLHAESGGKPA